MRTPAAVLLLPSLLLACNEETVDLSGINDRLKVLEAEVETLEAENASLVDTIAEQAATITALEGEVNAMSAEYLTSADLSGYATESWVSGQGYSTDAVDSDLQDLSSYLSVDTSSDEIVFSGANVFIQSGSGYTDDDGTLLGLDFSFQSEL